MKKSTLNFNERKREFLLFCLEFNIIQFGEFTLKSGVISPFYIDLRPLATNSRMLRRLADLLLECVPSEEYELICGVPYAALPIATAMGLTCDKNIIIKRKEAKKYGTKKNIEGLFKSGQSCLVVEDVITSGKSLLETLPDLESEGLTVKNIVVVLDRMQQGVEALQNKGYTVYSLFTLMEMLHILKAENQITEKEFEDVVGFINQQSTLTPANKSLERKSIIEKASNSSHPIAKKLAKISEEKESNLILSADYTEFSEIEKIIEECKDDIVAIKIHADIIRDFDSKFHPEKLREIANKGNFLLLEDRKFGDIGNTQKLQLTQGPMKILDWADMVTAHAIGGKKAIQQLEDIAVIAILSMSSEGALTTDEYAAAAEEIALSTEHCIGGVSQNKINSQLLCFTPGVNMDSKGDASGQQYRTPEYVFSELHTDFIIVGRGIINSSTPGETAKMYRKRAWAAYQDSLLS